MGIRAAKAGMPGPVNPMNPAFLHMYMPLLDGRFPYNISPVQLAALAMANNFPDVLLGGGSTNGVAAASLAADSERLSRLSGRSSCSPGANNSNKTSVHSRSSASSASPSPSSGHASQAQALNLRRSAASTPVVAEDLRRKDDAGKKTPVARSEDAPLNLSKPRGSSSGQSRTSPLVSSRIPSPSTGLHSSPSASPHAALAAGLRTPPHPHSHPHPLLSSSVAAGGKFPGGLSSWQPSPLFAPGFYSAPPFIPYPRTHQNGAAGDASDKPPFPFGVFPAAALDGLPLPAFPASSGGQACSNNGSKKESSGSSVGGFSDSSNLDPEKKEDTVVTCQSEYARLLLRCLLLACTTAIPCSSCLTVN